MASAESGSRLGSNRGVGREVEPRPKREPSKSREGAGRVLEDRAKLSQAIHQLTTSEVACQRGI